MQDPQLRYNIHCDNQLPAQAQIVRIATPEWLDILCKC